MTSRTESHGAAPVWGVRPGWRRMERSGRTARAAEGARARAPTRAVNRAAPALFERAASGRRLPSELVAAAVLAAVWIVLWTVFTAGVLESAAALHGAPSTPPAVSGETALASTGR